ncbi:MAG TPA: dicarboxylate/amino acid:cation symporter, partial [Ignavibacteriaceae bacterium]|nr:dicarboxylate/amino acid:cation symporter [Ignavibacteriaceae bacterium]
MLKLKLHWQILIAFIIAVLLGLFLPYSSEYVKWLGDLFLRALKMIIVPLVFSSIVSGVVNLGSSSSLGRLGAKTMTYYITTSLAAIITGLILVDIIRPGIGADLGFRMEVHELTSSTGSLSDIILRIVPTNLFEVFVKGDMLAIIFFALLFGFFIPRVPEQYSTPLINFFNSIFEVMMKLTSFIIKFAPIGILGIVTGIVADQASDKAKLISMLEHLGVYMLTVLSGLAIHMFITLPLLLKFIGKVRPFSHFKALSLPLITAFSTSSSSATLPLTIEAVENNVGVSNKISSLVLPLGATINMDGTALYECVAA